MPRFYTWDEAPAWPASSPHARLTPRVRIEAWDDEGWRPYAPAGVPLDDRSGALVSMLTHARGTRWRWGVWWLEPGAAPRAPLRFVVDRVGGGPVCSASFTTAQWLRRGADAWLRAADCSAPPPADDG